MLPLLLQEYFSIFFLFLISFILAFIIFFLSFSLGTQLPDNEKTSPYECGFEPFEDARNTFDVKFYLVAILFIIFDLEIMFLFPWSLILGSATSFSFWTMVLFLVILTIGFVFEWVRGGLEWV